MICLEDSTLPHIVRTWISLERQVGGRIRGQVMGPKYQAKGPMLFLVYSELLEILNRYGPWVLLILCFLI